MNTENLILICAMVLLGVVIYINREDSGFQNKQPIEKYYNYALIHTDGKVDSLVDAKEDGICGGFIVLYQKRHSWKRIQIGSEYKWVVPAK